MPAPRGCFILFEGVDRCGKTTQARLLCASLSAAASASGAGAPAAVAMRFPDRETAVGGLINRYLTREVELDDVAVHLLFSANRWEARAQLLRALRGGADVVCDRYAYSGAAFTAAKGAAGLDLAWCKAPDAGLPAPDLILFMDLPPAAAAARAGFGGERYETPALQAAVRARFAALRDEVAATAPGVWHDVDAAGTVEEVAARIAPLVEAARARVRAGGDAGAVRTLWNGAPLEEPGPLT
jgi:dTMP kinase